MKMETIKYWRAYLKDVEKRYGSDVPVYIVLHDGTKMYPLQTIGSENGKKVLYLRAVRM
jgi:hypothetical protein